MLLHHFNQRNNQGRDNFLLNKELSIEFLLHNHTAVSFQRPMEESDTGTVFLVSWDGVTV